MSNSRPTSPHRIRFNFWLNMDKDEEEKIADQIEILKNQRQFTATIRDGIQLIMSLRNGNLDVLFDLFPWIQPEMIKQFQAMGIVSSHVNQETISDLPEKEALNGSDQSSHSNSSLVQEQQKIEQLRADQEAYERDLERWAREREKQIAAQWEHIEREKERLAAEREKSQSAIEKRLEKLEQLLIQQGNQPIERPSAGRGGDPKRPGGPQSLGNNNLPPPVFDDDEDADLLEVKESEGGQSDASMNFIRSVQRLMEL